VIAADDEQEQEEVAFSGWQLEALLVFEQEEALIFPTV
jgi:hypothetical protein